MSLSLQNICAKSDDLNAVSFYVQIGRVREGLGLVERAVRSRPEEPEGWFTWAWCLYETGALDRLGELWREMPAAPAEQPRLLRYHGMWAEASEDWAEAERVYRATLQRDPFDRKAHYQLARVLRRNGHDAEAAEHEAEARRLDDAREALARCYTSADQQNDNPPAELCRQFSRWCRALGRTRQADCWDQEASRRDAPGGVALPGSREPI